ncbi:hypothetical protein E5K00_13960 [Hymenobacter aquaticus]|uniref:SMI1/KNR4 family protein n=1 Tax=Hymenobacter aquaticus TaxID=1867101 RepID=A0A4Z0PUC7_9BACT|nr:hypothetical protein [Hymenobacter aquaticus]TGE21390.1 hypothetical protein E5K00_13960 [Hymenobacter aquaticus]
MISSATTLPEILVVLRLFWRRQGIAGLPIPLLSVREIAAVHGLVLPPDFEQLYSTVNGMPQIYPSDMDENGFSVLPVEALHPQQQDFLVIHDQKARHEQMAVTVFVDYLQGCWWYGFAADASGETYRIGIMPAKGVFKVLTTSLAEFLQWYVEDADALYHSDYTFETLL